MAVPVCEIALVPAVPVWVCPFWMAVPVCEIALVPAVPSWICAFEIAVPTLVKKFVPGSEAAAETPELGENLFPSPVSTFC
jgi:hypothetical protein